MFQPARVVLITGASSGIGAATALAFARRGAHVIATARRVDRLDALAARAAALPGDVIPVEADVRDREAIALAVAQAVERFGRLDVLVANAGLGQRGPFVDAPWDDIETLLRTNIDGVLHSVRAAVPAMRARGGHIIIVSSVVAPMTTPYTAAYAASKAFVSSMARSLRYELEADNIAVVDLLVGRTESEFNEKRLGQPGRARGAARLPVMSADFVAEAIVRTSNGRSRSITLRPLDRVILIGNALLPGFIARRAARQYR